MKRIVVIEDDPDVRMVLESLFESQGYEGHFFCSGKDALPEVERIMPDLVIMDLMMSEMSGFEVCHRIRTCALTRHLPLLAISGYDSQEYRRKIFECGINAYLPKPFELKTILSRIEALTN